MNTHNTLRLAQLITEKIHITASTTLDGREAPFRDAQLLIQQSNHAAQDLVFQINAYIIGIPTETIDIDERWPADWWQALRDRWFPRWWLRRHPVQYHQLSLHTKKYGPVCPHLRAPDQRTHLAWIYNASKEPIE